MQPLVLLVSVSLSKVAWWLWFPVISFLISFFEFLWISGFAGIDFRAHEAKIDNWWDICRFVRSEKWSAVVDHKVWNGPIWVGRLMWCYRLSCAILRKLSMGGCVNLRIRGIQKSQIIAEHCGPNTLENFHTHNVKIMGVTCSCRTAFICFSQWNFPLKVGRETTAVWQPGHLNE